MSTVSEKEVDVMHGLKTVLAQIESAVARRSEVSTFIISSIFRKKQKVAELLTIISIKVDLRSRPMTQLRHTHLKL